MPHPEYAITNSDRRAQTVHRRDTDRHRAPLIRYRPRDGSDAKTQLPAPPMVTPRRRVRVGQHRATGPCMCAQKLGCRSCEGHHYGQLVGARVRLGASVRCPVRVEPETRRGRADGMHSLVQCFNFYFLLHVHCYLSRKRSAQRDCRPGARPPPAGPFRAGAGPAARRMRRARCGVRCRMPCHCVSAAYEPPGFRRDRDTRMKF